MIFSNLKIRLCVIFLFCFLTGMHLLCGTEAKCVVHINFDAELPNSFKIFGSPIILPDGQSGKSLQLKNGDYFTLDKSLIAPTGGSITFWIMPQWDKNSEEGHCMVSGSWQDEKKSYFVFSDGWWEPDGRNNSYFIRNNEEKSYVNTGIFYPQNIWCHIAIVWQHGTNGYTELYINGIRKGGNKNKNIFKEQYVPNCDVVFGSDKGRPGSKSGRFARGLYDEIKIYSGALSKEEIEKEFKQEAGDWKLVRSQYREAENLGKSPEQISWEDSLPQALKAHPAMAFVQNDPKLPNILIIGDSISLGYTPPLRDELKGVANVYRIPANGGPTDRGLSSIENWLGERKWDLIYFNWGLHDSAYKDWDIRTGIQHSSLEQYEKNLEALVIRLKQRGSKLIWASTTPIPDGAGGNIKGDSAKYNNVAAKIMQKHEVYISDLYGYVLADLAKYQLPQNIHFSNEGSVFLAKKIAEDIRAMLK